MVDETSHPPKHIGDPDGYHWKAGGPSDVETSTELREFQGPVIRFMWDYGVTIPLWDGDGLVPEESEWLREALGLTDTLIVDLAAWGEAMNRLDATANTHASEAEYAHLDAVARELVVRLQAEVGADRRVEYRPW